MFVTAKDGIKLYDEQAGEGTPIVFVHEFGGNHASWEPQMRFFTRRYRCITYAARGYPPSDVPAIVECLFAGDRGRRRDRRCWMGSASPRRISSASRWAALPTVHFGLRRPRARAVADRRRRRLWRREGVRGLFPQRFANVADKFERGRKAAFAKIYGEARRRVQFQNKDPRGWQRIRRPAGEHSDGRRGHDDARRAGAPPVVLRPRSRAQGAWRCRRW